MPAAPSRPLPAADSSVRDAIAAAAHRHLFAYGYGAWTMADLARELGMSKKTLYLHFDGKDAIIADVLNRFAAGVCSHASALIGDERLSFTQKLHHFTEAMVQRLARIGPHTLRDLQRCAPHLYRHIEELRFKNIPVIFGRLLRQGQAAGMVHAGTHPDFAIEFWRAAIQGVMHPDALERLHLRPEQVLPRAIDLFFGGLLTPAGRKDYEKQFHR